MVHLQEKKVIPIKCEAPRHRSKHSHDRHVRSVLTGIDMSVHGMVHFGDGSSVNIEGLSSMIMKGHGGEH